MLYRISAPPQHACKLLLATERPGRQHYISILHTGAPYLAGSDNLYAWMIGEYVGSHAKHAHVMVRHVKGRLGTDINYMLFIMMQLLQHEHSIYFPKQMLSTINSLTPILSWFSL